MTYSIILLFLVPFIAVKAYNFLSGKRLLLDLIHLYLLQKKDIQKLDSECSTKFPKSDFIVSMTSLPSRIGKTDLTIKSLLWQKLPAKEIRIYLPKFSEREQLTYEIPTFLRNLKCVQIIWVEKDWGPATKFIPALLEFDETQRILVVDDDNCYPPTYLSDFHKWSDKVPNQILTGSGWKAPADLIDRPTTLLSNIFRIPPTPLPGTRTRQPLKTDIIQGYAGYLISHKWLDMDNIRDYSKAPQASRFVDDVWISAHAIVPKYIIPLRRFCYVPWFRKDFYKSTSLARINTHEDHDKRNNSTLLAFFANRWK